MNNIQLDLRTDKCNNFEGTLCLSVNIYGEVLLAVKEKGFAVIGAPCESDHQFVACQTHWIIDYFISTD